ncbi:TIGR04283 family arsenosugar biosynthesis glycosyltransferase [Pandoraea sp.]|uniref:TIGR04283 family arsenosugar biosynthesis glycosyltransferase n=1 Tax=Pandoraea sp. TaxID=1883445 RepID=UPI0011F619A5|nr:TIGR04283 family arsenosugar biosynthesis glycosyltransferase [Pandoraea sp.]TAL53312.1 MAG: glycosyltransferase [Pandoraea sp.]TAM20252.1 MAG: glycosyltransferase [Pandoraea sp.]
MSDAPLSLSIVVPVLNEAAGIAAALRRLAPLRALGAEVIVVDGGSHDATRELAKPHADRLLTAPRGRAAQMNAGAALAHGDVLLFLHADTYLPADAHHRMTDALQDRTHVWGRFDVRIESRHRLLRVVATLMNLRSRISGVATGDQAIFVARRAFAQVAGFPAIALMEDIALSKRLRRLSPPACIGAAVVTSGRRWEARGVWRTIALMWGLRLAYVCGVAPATLARWYGSLPANSAALQQERRSDGLPR